MTRLQKFVSYIALGVSIFGAYFLTIGCPQLSTAGQGAVALMAPVLIGTPVSFVCLLVFIVLEEYAIRKKTKEKGQGFGIEARLV